MTARPRLLDLFCGGGGCAVGYHRAGFDVVGVDIIRQHEYPYAFVRADAMTYPLDGFDVIHASPPCKTFSASKRFHENRPRLFDPLVDCLTPTLDRFAALSIPWVVENVIGAPLPDDAVQVCGSSFGLGVRRHRLFASNVHLIGTTCDHASQGPVISVVGHSSPGRGRGVRLATPAERAEAMGIDWLTDRDRLSQAIPPAYTQHVGRQLLDAL